MTPFLQKPSFFMSKISTWMTLSLLMKWKTRAPSLIAPPHPPPEREERGKGQTCHPVASRPRQGLLEIVRAHLLCHPPHPSLIKDLLTQALCHQRSPDTHLSPPNPLPNTHPLPGSVNPPLLLHHLLKPLPPLVRKHNRASQNLQPKQQILHHLVSVPAHPPQQLSRQQQRLIQSSLEKKLKMQIV